MLGLVPVGFLGPGDAAIFKPCGLVTRGLHYFHVGNCSRPKIKLLLNTTYTLGCEIRYFSIEMCTSLRNFESYSLTTRSLETKDHVIFFIADGVARDRSWFVVVS